jgi:hypothetical protein
MNYLMGCLFLTLTNLLKQPDFFLIAAQSRSDCECFLSIIKRTKKEVAL